MRPGPTQADILIPFVGNQAGVLELLDNIVERTEIACRIIVCDDGNQASVMEGIRAFAKNNKIPMVAFRNDQPLGWAASVRRCRERINNQHDWFALLPPEHLLESSTWLGQLIAPLQRDPVAYAAMANPDTPWGNNQPVRLQRAPHIRRTLTMFKRRSNPPIPEGRPEDYGEQLYNAALKTGNTVWEVSACRVKPSSGALFKFVELPEPELLRRADKEPLVAINR